MGTAAWRDARPPSDAPHHLLRVGHEAPRSAHAAAAHHRHSLRPHLLTQQQRCAERCAGHMCVVACERICHRPQNVGQPWRGYKQATSGRRRAATRQTCTACNPPPHGMAGRHAVQATGRSIVHDTAWHASRHAPRPLALRRCCGAQHDTPKCCRFKACPPRLGPVPSPPGAKLCCSAAQRSCCGVAADSRRLHSDASSGCCASAWLRCARLHAACTTSSRTSAMPRAAPVLVLVLGVKSPHLHTQTC